MSQEGTSPREDELLLVVDNSVQKLPKPSMSFKTLRKRSNTLQPIGSFHQTRDAGSSNPPRVIEVSCSLKENPAKHHLKLQYMQKYRDLVGMSQLIVQPKQQRDLKVRSQDIKTLITATERIEQAHKRLNQRVEDILLANQEFCASKIEFIQDTDDKAFYKVFRGERSSEQNVILNNPIFNTFYDDVMLNRQRAQDLVRAVNQVENPFRTQYIADIKNSKECPTKFKELLLQPFQNMNLFTQANNSKSNDEDSQELYEQATRPQIEVFRDTNPSRKTFQSGKPFFQTQCPSSHQDKRIRSYSLFQESSILKDKIENHNNNSSYVMTDEEKRNTAFLKSTPFQTSPRIQRDSKASPPPFPKQTFKENLNVYMNLPDTKRENKLYFYKTNSEMQTLNQSLPSNPNGRNSSEAYKKQMNIHQNEKQACQYKTYKYRIPRLSVNHYAMQKCHLNKIPLFPEKSPCLVDNP